MKRDRLLTKLLGPLGGVIGLLYMAVLLAGCTLPKEATATPTRTPTLTLTPTQTPTPTVTFTPSPTPDLTQQPPGYRLVAPEFFYQFFDPPAAHSGQQAVVYWNGDSCKRKGYLEYLTFEGERGQLFYFDMARRCGGVSLGDNGHSIVFNVSGERDKEEYYTFDLLDRSVLGFAYDYKAVVCSSRTVGEEYIVLGCRFDGEISERYYYFIPRSNPERVTRGEEGGPYSSLLYWQGDRLISWDMRGNVHWYCIFDILPGQPICKGFDDEDWVGTLPSPDGKWLEIRQGNHPHQPDKVGLIPFSCVEDPATDCEPHWLPIQSISSNWVWDCKELAEGVWTPDSQQLLFLVDHPTGTAGPDPNANCKGIWTGQELWRYDLPTDTLEKIRQYGVVEKNLWFPYSYAPSWAPDGKHFVAYLLEYDDFSSRPEVCLVSAEDGEMTLIGEIPSRPLGVIQLP